MNDNNPLRDFTILGRLWIIACIALGSFALLAYIEELWPGLPPGRYPLLMFLLPVALATFAIYGIGYGLLRLLGFRLRK